MRSSRLAVLVATGLGVALLSGVSGAARADRSAASATKDEAAAPSGESLAPRAVLRLPWAPPGSPGQGTALGRRGGDESAPEGPGAMLPLPAGSGFAVLDTVAARVLHLDAGGRLLAAVALPGTAFQDLAALPDGRLAAVDRLVRRSLALIDLGSGRMDAELPIPRSLAADGGLITSAIGARDGLWLEIEHRESVHVLDAYGQATPSGRARTVRGRPVASGGASSCVARIVGPDAAVLTLEDWPSPGRRRELALRFSAPLSSLDAVEVDAQSRVHVLATLEITSYSTELDAFVEVERILVAPDSRQIARHRVARPLAPWERFRPAALGPDDRLYEWVPGDQGVEIWRW
jgi:hypothetical protein